MKGTSYHYRDYAFGQTMFNVRAAIRLTQAEMAEQLGVSRKAVREWEGGLAYPSIEHLKAFIVLAIKHRAFPTGRAETEIHTLWQAAHQKVPLDNVWPSRLFSSAEAPSESLPAEETSGTPWALASPEGRPHVDWNDAFAITAFYGREWELNLLTFWIVEERCRVVSIVGLGGIGKSALGIHLMHQAAWHFKVVIWRSLRDAPGCESLLDECLQVLAPGVLRDESIGLEGRLSLLMDCFRHTRVLLVVDNLETVFEEGKEAGHKKRHCEHWVRSRKNNRQQMSRL